MSESLFSRLQKLNPEKFCVGCNSQQGWDEDRPDWCAICWDMRRPLDGTIQQSLPAVLNLIEAAREYEDAWRVGWEERQNLGDPRPSTRSALFAAVAVFLSRRILRIDRPEE